jgi:hypothetical protein
MVRTTPQAMRSSFVPFAAAINTPVIVVESGTHSRWMGELVTELGLEVVVENPSDVWFIDASKTKTDRLATVVLGIAPQGGQGVFTAVRTLGLEAHLSVGIFSKGLDAQVRIVDETSGERDVLGEFFTSSFISCVEGAASLATKGVFGLDAARFGFGFGSDPGTDAALQAIDGHTVSLEADLIDDNNAELPIARAVVLDAAPDSIENP